MAPVDLHAAQISRNDTGRLLMQMDPTGLLNTHQYCTSKDRTSIGSANIIIIIPK